MNSHRYIDGTKTYKDLNVEKQLFHDVALEVLDELYEAAYRFPPMRSPHEGWAIVHEEEREMWSEVMHSKPVIDDPSLSRSIDEAVQVAAMAIRYVKDMREKYM